MGPKDTRTYSSGKRKGGEGYTDELTPDWVVETAEQAATQPRVEAFADRGAPRKDISA